MYERAGQVAKKLGVSTEFLKQSARRGELPEGSVLATPGGHYTYDTVSIQSWMQENYKRQTRISRLEAKR